MAHVSSLTASSYPYRGTLLRLDTNGDGMLSREELAADQRPGLLAMAADTQSSSSNAGISNLVAKLMQLPTDGKTDVSQPDLMQPGTDAGSDDNVDTQAAMDLYRGTYGQYALDDIAA